MEEYQVNDYILSNDEITIKINKKGAELSSLRKDGVEYMWQADPKYWGRSAPILFPLVGSLKNKEYRYAGNTYQMNQHGFARDMEFELIEQTKERLRFSVRDTEETLKSYPFKFCLEIVYRILNGRVSIEWIVKNEDNKEMYFSIGGHPAFMCPIHEKGRQTDYFLKFTKNREAITYFDCTAIGNDGLAQHKVKRYELKEGILPITEELFLNDALVIEHAQTHAISLLDSGKKEYLRVEYDAPVVGVWTPPGKEAPFICIEPWYGRCDRTDFSGELIDREWGNALLPDKIFEKKIEIITF